MDNSNHDPTGAILTLVLIITVLLVATNIFFSDSTENHNTEQVCFDKEGSVIFYSSGYKPGKLPVIHLTGNIHKIISTNEALKGECRSSWGANKPKGLKYWKIEDEYYEK